MHARQGWQDAFDTQMGIWHWLRHDDGHRWMISKFKTEIGDEFSNEEFLETMAKLYASQPMLLAGATPYFVSNEMCQVVEAASETFVPEQFLPSDLMTPTGFLYLEQPLTIIDKHDKEIEVAAFSWAPILSRPKGEEALDGEVHGEFVRDEQGRVLFGEYAAEDDAALMRMLRERASTGGHTDGVCLTLYATVKDEIWPERISKPPLVPMHLTPWWFAMSPDDAGVRFDASDKPTAAERWWRIVQTTLRLMQQHISLRQSTRVTRPQRREATRSGWDTDEVVVVRLRREATPQHEAHEAEAANYSHRFIVGGHWRNQFYPASNVHRQIWISPYVKGPEDKPLVVKPRRAVVWSR